MKPTARRLPVTLVLSVVAALWAGGCGQTGEPEIAVGATPLPAGGSAEFIDRVSAQSTVSQADAVEGVVLLIDAGAKAPGQPAAAQQAPGQSAATQPARRTFAEGVKLLSDRGIVWPGWKFQPDAPIQRGQVAYMIYQACDMTGGLTLMLTGPSRRYCLRELDYRGLMSPGPVYNNVTGMEFVAILARADELRQTGKVSEVMVRQEGLE